MTTLYPSTFGSCDTFTRAYIEAALWSTMNGEGVPLDTGMDVYEIPAEAVRAMAADCAKFQNECADLMTDDLVSEEQYGRDFWLTRNGHGTGFWDIGAGRDYSQQCSERLTVESHKYGEATLDIDDNGDLYHFAG